MEYKAPVDSVLFLLRDVLKFDSDITEAILTEAAKLAEESIAPTNQQGDEAGCFLVNGPGLERPEVVTPASFKEPWKQFCKGGWLGLSVPEEYGGQGLPYTIACVINEFVSSANMALSLYPGLTRGAIQALLEVATEEQKQQFIPKMATGEWTGTMNLTEPHCGTDLGLLKTKATVSENGTYNITGQKIFISCGEHDLSKNIIHLVLARVEGDQPGTKGISLFIVPKMIDDQYNAVSCGSIEHKMGIHGSSTCVMNYDGAVGYLVGERGKGLNAMFIMMNEARLGVAVQGLSQSELAYQNAVAYAKDRLQGRSLTGAKFPDRAADPIIVHPDVRRMLMDIKAVNEAGRLLILEAALLCEDKSDAAQDRLGLMTPILKGLLTDLGFENAVKAQQVFGGHGYIREWGMEQIVRDARIAQIYEGANGVQAMDLIGRKLPKNMGRAVKNFFDENEKILIDFMLDPLTTVSPIATDVYGALNDLKAATKWLMQNALKNPNNAGSAAYDYMYLFGIVLLGLAHVKIVAATDDADRHITAKYFIERILPETKLRLSRIQAGSGTMMSLSDTGF